MLVNPSATQYVNSEPEEKVADNVLHIRFCSMNLSNTVENGQFSDVDKDDSHSDESLSHDDDGWCG